LTPLLPYLFKEPRAQDTLILLSFVSLATIGQILMISAFSFAQASLLAPFQYMQLLSAIIFGLLVFDAFPDIFTLTGASMLIIAGLFITYRENKIGIRIN
ncbi:MAG: EamA/RhaT family transporter, partial [Pseudomonadota bacterium]|nr:EamA/RhaT family transporter [Pseudomonadota bacterium]